MLEFDTGEGTYSENEQQVAQEYLDALFQEFDQKEEERVVSQ